MRHFAREHTRTEESKPKRSPREPEQTRAERNKPTHIHRSLDHVIRVQIPASQPLRYLPSITYRRASQREGLGVLTTSLGSSTLGSLSSGKSQRVMTLGSTPERRLDAREVVRARILDENLTKSTGIPRSCVEHPVALNPRGFGEPSSGKGPPSPCPCASREATGLSVCRGLTKARSNGINQHSHTQS